MRFVVVILAYTFAIHGGLGERYGDYSGGLPHYNVEYGSRGAAPSDEYPDRSPDASPLLDYKYEEEPQDMVKIFPAKRIDDEAWQKPKVKGRRPSKMKHVNQEEIDARDAVVPKYKSNRRFIKHRTRIKDDKIGKPNRRRNHQERDQSDDIDDLEDRNDFEIDKRPLHEDNIESKRFVIRHTTLRVPRRKPRDRTISPETETRFEIDSAEDIGKIERVDEDSDDVRNTFNRHPQKVLGINEPPPAKKKPNPKAYPDYEEYGEINLKRVDRLKSRLPELFRRTKASDAEPVSTRRMQEDYYRRAFPPEEVKPVTTSTTKTTEIITKAISPMISRERTTNRSPTSTSLQTSIKQDSNMSLAEKSRLSILKKAQRKESAKNETTTKPPVLMQVTKKMQTVIMVERNDQEPLLRARQVFEDSPERIEKAKQLMRRKLVAGARNIHELTDNWDEMICDYIDVSLLDSKTNSNYYSFYVILLCLTFNVVIALTY